MIESPSTINRSWSVAACTGIFLINSPGYVILKKMISEKLVGWSKDKNQNQKGVKLNLWIQQTDYESRRGE